MKKFDLLIYIGRFQPPHIAHIKTIEQALEQSKFVKVFLGSSFQPRTPKDPWLWDERWTMIHKALHPNIHLQGRASCQPIRDIPEDNKTWADQIRKSVEYQPGKIGLVGHYKDESSFYLNLFPEWELVEIENSCGTNATDIREEYFGLSKTNKEMVDILHPRVYNYLMKFRDTEDFEKLWEEIHND